jgi:hypothetical protein
VVAIEKAVSAVIDVSTAVSDAIAADHAFHQLGGSGAQGNRNSRS